MLVTLCLALYLSPTATDPAIEVCHDVEAWEAEEAIGACNRDETCEWLTHPISTVQVLEYTIDLER